MGFILRCLNEGNQVKYYKVKDQRYLGEDEFIGQIECKERNFESTMYDIPIEEIVFEVSDSGSKRSVWPKFSGLLGKKDIGVFSKGYCRAFSP